jgi:hypothetical protein
MPSWDKWSPFPCAVRQDLHVEANRLRAFADLMDEFADKLTDEQLRHLGVLRVKPRRKPPKENSNE